MVKSAKWPGPYTSLQKALYLIALSLAIFSNPITYAGKCWDLGGYLVDVVYVSVLVLSPTTAFSSFAVIRGQISNEIGNI